MSTIAWPALGTTVGIDEAYPAGGTYTLIGQVLSISGAGGGEVGKRDTTNLSSTAKSYFPTIPDNGELSLELNIDPTDTVHQFLIALKNTPPTGSAQSYTGFNNFKVTFATAATTTSDVCAGFVTGIDGLNAGGTDENLTATITIQRTGASTFTG